MRIEANTNVHVEIKPTSLVISHSIVTVPAETEVIWLYLAGCTVLHLTIGEAKFLRAELDKALEEIDDRRTIRKSIDR